MFNYIKADFKRILTKKSFLIPIILYCVVFGGLIFFNARNGYSIETFMDDLDLIFNMYLLVAGIPIFIGVFQDAFKSKSIQLAIGCGVSRRNVLISRLILSFIIMVLVSMILLLVGMIFSIFFRVEFSLYAIREIFISMIFPVITAFIYFSICSIFIYGTSSENLGMIAYILLATKILVLIFTLVLNLPSITKFVGNISNYLPTNSINSLKYGILTGAFPIKAFITVVLYVTVSVFVAIRIFKNKELEF